MNKIPDEISQAITADVQAAIDAAEMQQKVAVSLSAQELARENGVHAQTVTAIISRMGLEWDGYAWYKKTK